MSDFASNLVFVAPLPAASAEYEGEPTKVAMTEAQRANGFVPEEPIAAEHLNQELNQLTSDVADLIARIGGKVLASTFYTGGQAGTHLYDPQCVFRIAELQGAGGGGGGVAGATNATRVSVGGQAGRNIRLYGPPGDGVYSVGSSGTAGDGSGSVNGGPGGNTVFEGNTATGGVGGDTVNSGGTTPVIIGPARVTNAGPLGSAAINLVGYQGPAITGTGGASAYGGNAPAQVVTGTGALTLNGTASGASAYGAGGAGSAVNNSTGTATGAVGIGGLLHILEIGG